MRNRYLFGLKTLLMGAIIGVAGNLLTNASGYFGDKVIKTVFPMLGFGKNEGLDDGKGHRITYRWYHTSEALLENILEGDPISEKVGHTVNRIFSFAKEEGIPCDCVPLLTLLALQNLDITIIVDDSTSMGSRAENRWEECRKSTKMIANFGLTSENSSVTIKFLNQKGISKITRMDEVDALFIRNPNGATPLIKTLESTIAEIKEMHEAKRHLIYVLTDGIPTDGAYYQPILTWVRDIFSPDREISDNVAINFIVEGANLSAEKEYKKVDDYTPQDGRMLHIDTNLSYALEKSRCQDIILTEGLYKMKILMGAVNEDFDDLDEPGKENRGFRFLKDAWGTLRELNANLLTTNTH